MMAWLLSDRWLSLKRFGALLIVLTFMAMAYWHGQNQVAPGTKAALAQAFPNQIMSFPYQRLIHSENGVSTIRGENGEQHLVIGLPVHLKPNALVSFNGRWIPPYIVEPDKIIVHRHMAWKLYISLVAGIVLGWHLYRYMTWEGMGFGIGREDK